MAASSIKALKPAAARAAQRAAAARATTRRAATRAPAVNTATNGSAAARALSSGTYVFYQDATALSVGVQTLAPGASGFQSISECFLACDFDNACSAVVIEARLDAAERPRNCRLVKGNTRLGSFKRSMARADVARLQVPQSLF